MSESPRDLRFAIIGAGMAGILSAIKLQEAGLTDFTIYEKADRFGGTWRENTYPGLACDVPSHLYSYSFAPNPEWSHRFSPGDEIRDYFEQVAADHGLDAHARFGEGVVRCEYTDGTWRIETTAGPDGRGRHRDRGHRACCTIRGCPTSKASTTFGGACFHSARWDHAVRSRATRVGVDRDRLDRRCRSCPRSSTTSRSCRCSSARRSGSCRRRTRPTPTSRRRRYRADSDATRGDARAPRRDVRHVRQRGRRQALAADQDDRGDVPRRTSSERARSRAARTAATRLPRRVQAARRLTELLRRDPAAERRARHRRDRTHRARRACGTRDGRLHELDVLVLATGFRVERLHAADDRHRA